MSSTSFDAAGDFGADDYGDLPFLQEAGRLLAERGYGLSIEDLAEDWAAPLVEAGAKRARAALSGEVDRSLDGMPLEQRILSFVIAALIVRATGNQYLIKKFALAEARRLEERILQRMNSNRDDAAAFLRLVYSRVLGVRLERANRRVGSELFEVSVDLRSYLELSSSLDISAWGIANRIVDGGRVYLHLQEAARLLRNAIADRVERRVSSIELPRPPAPIAEEASKLLEEAAKALPVPTAAAARAGRGQYPPCVRSVLKRLEAGENLPHSARFFLAAFMLNVGMSVDEVVALFRTSPDFNERITRYQVEHIAGARGGKRYSVPSCSKLAAQGLCARDETCGNVKNPLSYVRRRTGGGSDGGGGARRRGDRVPEDEL